MDFANDESWSEPPGSLRADVNLQAIPAPGPPCQAFGTSAMRIDRQVLDPTVKSSLAPRMAVLIAFWLLSATTPPAGRAVEADRLAASDFFETTVRPLLSNRARNATARRSNRRSCAWTAGRRFSRGDRPDRRSWSGKPDESLLVQAVAHTPRRTEDAAQGQAHRSGSRGASPLGRDGRAWADSSAAATAAVGQDQGAGRLRSRPLGIPPISQSTAPDVKNRTWVRSPVDAFVLARLEQEGITPSPAADRRTLIRRATIRPPGHSADGRRDRCVRGRPAPDAFARVVDRLLASPHYGERWGRHWLDVARYADTKGYVFTEERKYPFAYTYRDYVIQAFNADLPFDQFLLQQIAADQLDLRRRSRPAGGDGLPHGGPPLPQRPERDHRRPHRPDRPGPARLDCRLRAVPRPQV